VNDAEKTQQLVIFGEERFLGPISRKAGSALGMAGKGTISPAC